MPYPQQLIYLLAGMNDEVAPLTLKDSSPICDKFDKEVTVVFQYTQREREKTHKELLAGLFTYGIIRAKVLNYGNEILFPDEDDDVFIEINSEDIEYIFHWPLNAINNTFLSKEKRSSKRIEIEVESRGDGRHWDNYYVFERRRVEEDNIILSPEERYRYLAMRLFYESDSISEQERKEIFDSTNSINENVAFYYYKIAEDKNIEVNDTTIKYLSNLAMKRANKAALLLNESLTQAGSSVKKLLEQNPKLTSDLFLKIQGFRQKRLNISGKYPIYLDQNSYMHILTRHVEEFKFNNHFAQKDNFQWVVEDVMMVIEKVIRMINIEYQTFRMEHPDKKFSKYGDKSVYYQGDYYTLHIEPSGRIATFHKNKKNI